MEENRVYLDERLSTILEENYEERKNLLIKLFHKKSEIISVYKDLYEPVIKFKNKYYKQLASYEIDFDAAFEVKNFLSNFDAYINYGKSGSFRSRETSAKKINDLLSETNFNDIDNLLKFTEGLILDLLYDTRVSNAKEQIQANAQQKSVQSQLKLNVKPEDIYDYIYGLEYLDPVFKLKLAGKEIVSLSPGERGALLLIFYLLLDNDNIPLVIDQPEENLDNQSIYSILVPFIKEAKKRRQVILVAHNPNLAVVCDANQIIHIKIDKKNNHRVTCKSGAIENPEINELIIEVLEGTFPAFNTRSLRYEVTRSRSGNLVYTNS